MKYIRTNSDIYSLDDLYVCEELSEKPYATKDGGWCIYKESIIKEADTIEELCDVFVLENEIKTEEPYSLMKPETFKQWRQAIIEVKQTCYGAIWTPRGLYFAAMLNFNSGEFELR